MAGRVISGNCVLKVAKGCFHETGIWVLLGGRLRGVSPRRNCAPPGYPTRWSDRIVQSDHGACTTNDPTLLISQPFQSRAERRHNPTPICHSKTLTWSLHSPASSPVTSNPATPHHSTTRLLACHFWPRPSAVILKLHPSPVILRPFLRLSLYGYTPSGKSAPPLPPDFSSAVFVDPAPSRTVLPTIGCLKHGLYPQAPPSPEAPPLGPTCFPRPGTRSNRNGGHGAQNLTRWGFPRSGARATAGAGLGRRPAPRAGCGVGPRRRRSDARHTSPLCSATASCTGILWRSQGVRLGPGDSWGRQ